MHNSIQQSCCAILKGFECCYSVVTDEQSWCIKKGNRGYSEASE